MNSSRPAFYGGGGSVDVSLICFLHVCVRTVHVWAEGCRRFLSIRGDRSPFAVRLFNSGILRSEKQSCVCLRFSLTASAHQLLTPGEKLNKKYPDVTLRLKYSNRAPKIRRRANQIPYLLHVYFNLQLAERAAVSRGPGHVGARYSRGLSTNPLPRNV